MPSLTVSIYGWGKWSRQEAAKEHICYKCHRTIKPGVVYYRQIITKKFDNSEKEYFHKGHCWCPNCVPTPVVLAFNRALLPADYSFELGHIPAQTGDGALIQPRALNLVTGEMVLGNLALAEVLCNKES